MAQISWPFGAYPPGGLQRLGPHVTCFYADGYPLSNSAIVQGTDATLVFDANTLRWARTLRSVVDTMDGPPLRELVLSHIHSDHAHGAMHFVPPARSWARSFTKERLAYWATADLSPHAEEYAAHYPNALTEYRDVRIIVPEQAIDQERVLELGGGVRVHLRPEATAHTPGDLWALVQPDNVALCGDLWFNQLEPYVGHGSLQGSLTALAHLRESNARVYLPGHGPAGPLPSANSDMMELYCMWLIERIADAIKHGRSGEELRKTVRTEYDQQAREPTGIRFAYPLPNALDDAVEAAEAAVVQT